MIKLKPALRVGFTFKGNVQRLQEIGFDVGVDIDIDIDVDVDVDVGVGADFDVDVDIDVVALD